MIASDPWEVALAIAGRCEKDKILSDGFSVEGGKNIKPKDG